MDPLIIQLDFSYSGLGTTPDGTEWSFVGGRHNGVMEGHLFLKDSAGTTFTSSYQNSEFANLQCDPFQWRWIGLGTWSDGTVDKCDTIIRRIL